MVKILEFHCPYCGAITRMGENINPIGKEKPCKGCGEVYKFTEDCLKSSQPELDFADPDPIPQPSAQTEILPETEAKVQPMSLRDIDFPSPERKAPPISGVSFSDKVSPTDNTALRLQFAVALIIMFAGWALLYLYNKSSTPGYSKHMPASTMALMVINSPANSFQKLGLENHPELLNQIKQLNGPAEGDVTSLEFYQSKGLDITKSVGVSLLGDINSFKALFFWGISQEDDFLKFIKNTLAKQNIRLFSETIERTPCWMDNNQNPRLIFCFKEKYCYLLVSIQPGNLKSDFSKYVLSNKNRLANDDKFKACMDEITQSEDNYLYMDNQKYFDSIAKFSQQAGGNRPETKVFGKLKELTKDYQASIMASELLDDVFTASVYTHFNKEALTLKTLYDLPKTTLGFLDKAPANPLSYFFFRMNPKHAWEISKKQLDVMLPTMQAPVKNTNEILSRLERELGNMGVNINVKADIIDNLQGDLIWSLYSLPKSTQSIDFDMVLALGVKDTQKTQRILQDVFAKLKENPQINISEIKAGNGTGFVFDLSEQNPSLKIQPTIGISDGYLIVTTTKKMFAAIANGEFASNGLLSDIGDAASVEKSPMQGVLYLKRLIKECKPLVEETPNFDSEEAQMGLEFFKHIKKIDFMTNLKEQGLYQVFSVQADGEIASLVIKGASKAKKLSDRQRMAYMKVIRLPERTLKAQTDKLAAAEEFLQNHRHGTYHSTVLRTAQRLRMRLQMTTAKAYREIQRFLSPSYLPYAWQKWQQFPKELYSYEDAQGEPYVEKLANAKRKIEEMAISHLEKELKAIEYSIQHNKRLKRASIIDSWKKSSIAFGNFIQSFPVVGEMIRRSVKMQSKMVKDVLDKAEQQQRKKQKWNNFLNAYKNYMKERKYRSAYIILRKNIVYKNTKNYRAFYQEHLSLQKLFRLAPTTAKQKYTGSYTQFRTFKGSIIKGQVKRVAKGKIYLERKSRLKGVPITILSASSLERLIPTYKRKGSMAFALAVLFHYEGDSGKVKKYIERTKLSLNKDFLDLYK